MCVKPLWLITSTRLVVATGISVHFSLTFLFGGKKKEEKGLKSSPFQVNSTTTNHDDGLLFLCV